jgi:hypothetical protein
MAVTSISFEFKINRGKNFVKNGGFCIDANEYLCSHLKCEEGNLDDVLAKTTKKDIIGIAKWAYQNCDYMNNILLDYSGQVESSIADEEAKKLTEEGSDEYDEIYQDVLDELICRVSSAEIIINGKIYKGK